MSEVYTEEYVFFRTFPARTTNSHPFCLLSVFVMFSDSTASLCRRTASLLKLKLTRDSVLGCALMSSTQLSEMSATSPRAQTRTPPHPVVITTERLQPPLDNAAPPTAQQQTPMPLTSTNECLLNRTTSPIGPSVSHGATPVGTTHQPPPPPQPVPPEMPSCRSEPSLRTLKSGANGDIVSLGTVPAKPVNDALLVNPPVGSTPRTSWRTLSPSSARHVFADSPDGCYDDTAECEEACRQTVAEIRRRNPMLESPSRSSNLTIFDSPHSAVNLSHGSVAPGLLDTPDAKTLLKLVCVPDGDQLRSRMMEPSQPEIIIPEPEQCEIELSGRMDPMIEKVYFAHRLLECRTRPERNACTNLDAS